MPCKGFLAVSLATLKQARGLNCAASFFFIHSQVMSDYNKLLAVWLTTFASWLISAKIHNILSEISLIVAILASISTFLLQVAKFIKTIKNDGKND